MFSKAVLHMLNLKPLYMFEKPLAGIVYQQYLYCTTFQESSAGLEAGCYNHPYGHNY